MQVHQEILYFMQNNTFYSCKIRRILENVLLLSPNRGASIGLINDNILDIKRISYV